MSLAVALLLAAAPSPLAAVADRVLPDAGDTALVLDLSSGSLLLEHHPKSAGRALAPGSVMKPFTAYALLAAGLDRTAYVCRGEHVDASGVARPCWDRRGHGELRLRTALAASCNAWFHAAVEPIEPERIEVAWRAFGLLGPREALPPEKLDAAVGDHRALAITPRALLAATAILARREAAPGLDAAHLEIIAHGMEEAAVGGTLGATFAGLDVAAKSGTAPVAARPGTRGLVIGWLPARSPRFAFVLVKDRGRGARDAGPPARAIAAVLDGMR